MGRVRLSIHPSDRRQLFPSSCPSLGPSVWRSQTLPLHRSDEEGIRRDKASGIRISHPSNPNPVRDVSIIPETQGCRHDDKERNAWEWTQRKPANERDDRNQGEVGTPKKAPLRDPKGCPRCTSSPSCVGRRPGAAGTPTAGSTRFYRTTSIMPGLIALARKKRNRQGHLFLPQNALRGGGARNLDPRTPIL